MVSTDIAGFKKKINMFKGLQYLVTYCSAERIKLTIMTVSYYPYSESFFFFYRRNEHGNISHRKHTSVGTFSDSRGDQQNKETHCSNKQQV
jgi:hypothetical protein